MEKQNVYIIGSKGIPSKYGGFETFVDKLTEYQTDSNIQYYVACKEENSLKSNITKDIFEYNGAICFNIKVPQIGPAQAVYYDLAALNKCIEHAKKIEAKAPVFYILACRIGPFINQYKKKIKNMGGKLYVNPDGHEWLRAKWNKPIRKYWKLSERLMIKKSDLVICDSKIIEAYIKDEYKSYTPKTIYIAYGAETNLSKLSNDSSEFIQWLKEKDLKPFEYYLVVGRFVPENNYEIMIREFIKSKSKKNFALITNVDEKFLKELDQKTNYKSDSRIKFVGTVYNQELLKKIRECAYGYFHGHEVGGTNPSLLEALGSTRLNLLLDVGFNREVARDSALYWTKENKNLAKLIEKADTLDDSTLSKLDDSSKERVEKNYNWGKIVNDYEMTLLKEYK